MNIWFSADLHLGHTNIMQHCSRPFSDPVEMNEAILDRFNVVIRPGDVLYLLGDLCWSSFDFATWARRLNTKELHLIVGNHDESKGKLLKHIPTELFRSIEHIKSVTIGGKQITMCHYPMVSWRGRSHGAYHVFGHVHGKFPGIGRSMDVGVDTNNFALYSWGEIDARLGGKEIYPAGVVL